MNLNAWFGGAAAIAVIASVWSYLKEWAWKFMSLFVLRAKLEGTAATAVGYLCWSSFRRVPLGERRYSANNEFVRPSDRYEDVGFETIGGDTGAQFQKRCSDVALEHHWNPQAVERNGVHAG